MTKYDALKRDLEKLLAEWKKTLRHMTSPEHEGKFAEEANVLRDCIIELEDTIQNQDGE